MLRRKIGVFTAGDYLVSTNQALSVKYIIETLEPEALDSFSIGISLTEFWHRKNTIPLIFSKIQLLNFEKDKKIERSV